MPEYHRPRKRFGQHFLTDHVLIDNMVSRFAPQPGETIVEIGPGQGALTYPLLEKCQQLQVIELDRDLAAAFMNDPEIQDRLICHQADVLSVDFSKFIVPGSPLRIIGNLPYNISTPLLFHLTAFLDHIQDMVFMIQKEVADRICAQPGTKAYGRLSIMMQYFCESAYWFDVPPTAFDPPPKVDSAIIALRPRVQHNIVAQDLTLLNNVVTAAFSKRRKMIAKALEGHISTEALESLGISTKLRPENLSVSDFIKIANYISSSSG